MIAKDNNIKIEQAILRVQQSIRKNKENELFYIVFLRPIEIALKTYDTQIECDQVNINSQASTKQYGCLAFGLKQVIKEDIDDNQSALIDFQSIATVIDDSKQNFDIEEIKQSHCDNLISLLKPSKEQNHGLKVAICVCMSSEDKAMLKKTLIAISQNIIALWNNGIPYNQIGVFVLMDGIQAVQETVVQLFEEIQKENNIFLNENIQVTDPRILINEQRQFQDQQFFNLNHLIFDRQQLIDRKRRRFASRRAQYKRIKKMIKDIQELEQQKILTFDSLDGLQKFFFLQKAREHWKKQYATTDDQANKIKQQVLQQKYAMNTRAALPIIREALNEAKKYCKQYIETRDNFALLNTFRLQINEPQQNKDFDQLERSSQYFQYDQPKKNYSKMNLFFITKYKNGGKSSLHDWFLNGFCQQLKPQFAVLLDVGLVPQKDAIWKMVAKMQQNKDAGGVCGYISLRQQKPYQGQQIQEEYVDCITRAFLKIVNIRKAQQFQYHFAHLIDKPFESSFKFIHMLPGAFSAYRMAALRPSQSSDPKLLKQYFKSIDDSAASYGYAFVFSVCQTISKVVLPDFIFNLFYNKPYPESYEKLLYNKNVHLVCERVFCMSVHQNKYDLVYMPDACAWVDPIKSLQGFLGQHKKWINCNFFALQKIKQTFDQANGDCIIRLQMLYLTFMNMISFIAPALFLYTIHIAMYTFQANVIITVLLKLNLIANSVDVTKNSVVGIFVYIVDLIYVLIFLGLVFFSLRLTNQYKKFQSFLYGVSTTYGICSLIIFTVLLYDIISGLVGSKNAFLIQNEQFVQSITGEEAMINSLRYIMLGIIGLYIIIPILIAIVYGRCRYILDILFSSFSFLFYSPTYFNILNIYALCRMDDIYYGTKRELSARTRMRLIIMAEDWKNIKFIHVSKFVLYNLVVGFLLIFFGDQYVARFWFTFVIMALIGLTLMIRVFIGTIYMLIYRLSIKPAQNRAAHFNSIRNDLIDDFYFRKVKKSLYEQVRSTIWSIGRQLYQNQNRMKISSRIFKSIQHEYFENPKYRYKYSEHTFLLRLQEIKSINNRIKYKNLIQKMRKPDLQDPINGLAQQQNSNQRSTNRIQGSSAELTLNYIAQTKPEKSGRSKKKLNNFNS